MRAQLACFVCQTSILGLLYALVGGVLPFGACYVELFFILSSMWMKQYLSLIHISEPTRQAEMAFSGLWL